MEQERTVWLEIVDQAVLESKIAGFVYLFHRVSDFSQTFSDVLAF